jgi:hypothetical protein
MVHIPGNLPPAKASPPLHTTASTKSNTSDCRQPTQEQHLAGSPALPPKPTNLTARVGSAGRRKTLDDIAPIPGSGNHRVDPFFDVATNKMDTPASELSLKDRALLRSCCREDNSSRAKALGNGLYAALEAGCGSPASAVELKVRTQVANATASRIENLAGRFHILA